MWIKGNNPELDATKVPSAIDIAWAAGIYEGEGCCRNCGKTKRGFMASVAQKDPELLYRLREWFGGSIQDNAPKHDFRIWNICGDRARVFIALVYPYMTVRRKGQIDSTGALNFLGGFSPAGLNTEQLRSVMEKYYDQERRSRSEKAIADRRDKYSESSSDPKWSKKMNEYNAKLRANWTEEQREAARKYQREYKRKKKQQLLNVVEIRKTA